MARSRSLGRSALVVAAGLLVAGACSTPDVNFVKPQKPHCENHALDAKLGESDVDCGGGECHACTLGQGCLIQADCEAGQCLEGVCQEPGCDNQVRDSDETDVDCGGSCKKCQDDAACLGNEDCTSKVCKDAHCAAPACDDETRNGDEPDRDCGGSKCDGCPIGSPCNVASDCESSSCDETSRCALSCLQNTADCDGDFTCETNLLTSVDNCGGCGHDCDLPHAIAACGGGACKIDSCVEPWDRCNTDDADGCETNLSSDPTNCGACGMECPGVNGTPTCVDGGCRIKCDAGFGDCDEVPANGCEASVKDVANCGGCKIDCPEEEGYTANCVEGECGQTKCDAGLGDCNGDMGDGCEQDITSDVMNCGRCGGLCSVAHGTAGCSEGTCVVMGCEAGWDNCNAGDTDGGYSDGCEANLNDSGDNCGACGNACDVTHGSGACVTGTCQVSSCESGFENCDEADPDAGFGDGCETDTTSSIDHCGGCGVPCAPANATGKCVDSECQIDDCDAGFGDCTGADGCETNVTNNAQHCGDCPSVCSQAGATAATCSSGQCAAPSCDGTHLNCDGTTPADYANGCETVRSVTSCGSCGQVCMTAHAASGTACTSGGCVPSCDGGWGACGNPQDGCTTQLNASPNCGACAPAGTCSGSTPSCVTTGSTAHCQATLTLASNAVSNSATAASLTLTHALASGTNRLVLLAVTVRADPGYTIAQARPNTVTYGSLAMKAFGETSDGGMPATSGRAHLFYYYLTDSTSPALTGTGNQSVIIDGNPAPVPYAILANVVQFNGASQSAPIGASQTGVTTTTTVTVSLPLATTGSMIYTLTGAHYAHAPAASITAPASSPAMQSMFAIGVDSDTFWGAGAVSPVLNPATYTLQWAWQWAQNSVEYAIVIQPAQST